MNTPDKPSPNYGKYAALAMLFASGFACGKRSSPMPHHKLVMYYTSAIGDYIWLNGRKQPRAEDIAQILRGYGFEDVDHQVRTWALPYISSKSSGQPYSIHFTDGGTFEGSAPAEVLGRDWVVHCTMSPAGKYVPYPSIENAAAAMANALYLEHKRIGKWLSVKEARDLDELSHDFSAVPGFYDLNYSIRRRNGREWICVGPLGKVSRRGWFATDGPESASCVIIDSQ